LYKHRHSTTCCLTLSGGARAVGISGPRERRMPSPLPALPPALVVVSGVRPLPRRQSNTRRRAAAEGHFTTPFSWQAHPVPAGLRERAKNKKEPPPAARHEGEEEEDDKPARPNRRPPAHHPEHISFFVFRPRGLVNLLLT
jgi:hypothetical protein